MLLARILFCFALLVTAHNVALRPRGRECFFEDLNPGDVLRLNFMASDRTRQVSSPKIDFFVTDHAGRIIESRSQVTSGDWETVINTKGRYKYCFSNDASDNVGIEVLFNVHGIMHVDPGVDDELAREVNKLRDIVRQVKDEQEYIIVRERTHRNTAESTNSRVKYWSVFQLLVLVSNVSFQIWYLKRFFEVKAVI
ncbi:hypothetical protein CANCADRAFT_146792 [Tortispora caseinolytica NRRL Y-17796]|uniref:GOLD domain-containing protein n=1 Tax=Tortispora caseinolytica NRRL Y-17796 TaxID=767744 RepID=A0A1E4T9P5_9ASCO|nr:hypothetical protein CANCADRAFT_146792 [Tortispora caseinolytica NRRL Y-17796]